MKNIKTKLGTREFKSISVSELGFIMVKLFNKETKTYTTYRIGKLEELLKNNPNL